MTTGLPLHGLLAEFDTAEALVEAARRAREAGYRRMDAYSPMPIHHLAEALGVRDTRLPWLVLAGGIAGGLAGYFMLYYACVISYPINVGGRPLHSWPAFIPPTFELTILFAGVTAMLGMLALNGLPMPYHPVFNVPRFSRASRDRFFLCIESSDPQFHYERTKEFLQSMGPLEVSDVER